MTEATFEIKGMTCNMCVKHVRNALEDLDGIERANVDLQSKKARITYDESRVSPEQMRQAVKEAGYDLVLTVF